MPFRLHLWNSFTRFYCINVEISETKKRVPYAKAIKKIFESNPKLIVVKKYIPVKYLEGNRRSAPDNLYLICPRTARNVVDKILPYLDLSGNQMIAETNVGLGFITQELLDKGVPHVRMYEVCPDFRHDLKDFAREYPGRVELFMKDMFHLSRYEFMDRCDNSERVMALFRNVPVKSWCKSPVMSIIGTMTELKFLKYLILSLALQKGPTALGRIQIFAIMKSNDYCILNASLEDNLHIYQKWSILYQIFYDFEVLEKIPENLILPLDNRVKKKNFFKANLDADKFYLVRINFKKNFPVPTSQLLSLYYFVLQLFGKGNSKIIPTIEKWVPNSGVNAIIPKLSHKDFFQEMSIFTKFRELTAPQILALFKEVANNPGYSSSPFSAMVENELLKSETVETSIAESSLEKNIQDEIEEKLDDI